ncbi:tuftelin-interacting protein 11-like [Xenia sp. Carnegie-2017]|uniref:tuftelin-interacting protein 11-like n=1 Tax=Xenia sp. Carnegie-2017 TaxID=2897299 RepID=UPI001F041CF5|nr:tuftelin-interacting protein 11-like [Xenia sp. Carnegie-2017]
MADSDNEVERFEVTEYDLQNEFFPGMKRRKMTKEQTMLGIWAGRDSDEDDYSERKRNDSIPLQFVSGGVVKSKDKDELEQVLKRQGTNQEKSKKLFNDSSMLSAATFNQSDQDSKVYTRKMQRGAGKDFASWEQHTKGFGSKMLKKMGYEPGKGLGKEGQGISTPVEAFKRGGRGALSYYGPEKHTKKQEPQLAEDEKEELEFREQLNQWKKSSNLKGKPKYIYKTIDEVKASGKSKRPGISLSTSNVKVVDMTGREAKVLTGYGSFATQHANPEEITSVSKSERDRAFSLPELEYNLNLLLDLSETEIIQADKQLRHERDLIVNLKHEERLSHEIEQEENDMKQLVDVLKIIERCRQQSTGASDNLSLQDCEALFVKLQSEFLDLYKMYELVKIAIPLVFPKIKEHFEMWNPLKSPGYGLEVVKRWKKLLEGDKPKSFCLSSGPSLDPNSMDTYERLIWEIWMPIIRTNISVWNPRNCNGLVVLLENWLPLLPSWVYDNILNQILLPRLQAAVEAWNPLIDPLPIHSWIHPWLPLMGDRLEILYVPIRHKLSVALTNWHPSDPSAKLIIEPWIQVFSKGTLDAFVLRSIYPKLSLCLSEFVINPHQQHLEPFTWVMSWKNIVPFQHFVSLLEKHFFPKWLQVLRNWLYNKPNYDEITKWYMGWKSMFDEELLSNVTIKAQFNRGLDLMNQAVSTPESLQQPGAKENVAYLTNNERRREAEAKLSAGKMKYQAEPKINVTEQSIPTNFRDLLEKMSNEYDISFLPITGRRHEGKALYTFGKLTIFIERGVVFYQAPNGSFNPVSITTLVSLAK